MSSEPDKRPPAEPDPLVPGLEADGESLGEERLLTRLIGLLGRQSVRKRILAPVGFDGAILVTNLTTGIIVARALGPSGRGELAATLLVVQMAAWLFGVANGEALSFYRSRDPKSAARLLSGWVIATPPLALLGVAVTELTLPAIFAAQTSEAIDVARIYAAMIPVVSLQGIFNGMLLGDEDFFFYNVVRFLVPGLTALGYAIFWLLGSFSVELALVSNAAATVIALVAAAFRTLRQLGLARPDWVLFRKSFWYGAKAHVGSIAGLVNARLDLLIIPAFLTAASVGLYSVATNVTSITTVLVGTVALMVLPVATRAQDSARQVILTLQATMGIALTIAIPIGVLAPIALRIVYGADFESAATPLRILLPGAVLQAGIMVLWVGLLAANRPLMVSAAVMPAALLTIGGLIVFLPTGGINAAAIVTSVAYALEFALMIFLYRRTLGIAWSDYLRPQRA
jgi:O-antigen/teichoic acid export membrane protein